MSRRTKIICTLGPVTSTPEKISALIAAGMDVARINFSHGTPDQHAMLVQFVREAAAAVEKHVAIMVDLQGPKIRVGALDGGSVALTTGAMVTITTEEIFGNAERMSTTYEHFATDVKPGDSVLLADGLLRLRVESVHGNDVQCIVIDGGTLGEHQGINLPSTILSAPSLSEKDLDDLAHALTLDIEYIALSFVRTASDVTELRKRIAAAGGAARIVAKIERAEAVKEIPQVVNVSDGVMVARGDLGVELPPWEVPLIQKKIIRVCNVASTPVITATQMLESMIVNPRPTRAEASDVANAVLDGSDAVMLSGETAVGAHPMQAVAIMSEICENAEQDLHSSAIRAESGPQRRGMEYSVAHSACMLAEELGAKAVLCLTRSGTTARLLSQCRPSVPVIAMTDDLRTARRVALYWGVRSIVIPNPVHTESALRIMCDAAVAHGIAATGDSVVITGGHPLTQHARTNFVKVETL